MWQLQQEASAARREALADNSWGTRHSQWKCYVQFCATLNVPPTPASAELIACYLAYLARDKVFSSMKNYLSAVVQMHVMLDLPVDSRLKYS